MSNPLERYFPKKIGGDYVVDEIFRSNVHFREAFSGEDYSLYASSGQEELVVFDVGDIAFARGSLEGIKSNFQGLIGEGVFAACMGSLVYSILTDCGSSNLVKGKHLRETPKSKGKQYIVRSRGGYTLKHAGRYNFFVLKEADSDDPDIMFQQQKYGQRASEIDSLAYLHLGKRRYILIGESKTADRFSLEESRLEQLIGNVVKPLSTIFKGHRLVYVFGGFEESFFKEGDKLRLPVVKTIDYFESRNVNCIFLPFPEMPRTIGEYAELMHNHLPFGRALLKHLGNGVKL